MSQSEPLAQPVPVTAAPLVDYTTLNAIESLFAEGACDPAAIKLAGEFADVFAYAEVVRYPEPNRRAARRPDHPLLLSLKSGAAANLFEPLPYATDDLLVVPEDALLATFDAFIAWCEVRTSFFRKWIGAQRQPWVRASRGSPRGTIYDHAALHQKVDVRSRSRSLGVTERGLLYGLDVSLRYHQYAAHHGHGQTYLSHPVRTGPMLPTVQVHPSTLEPPAVSFASSIAAIAKSLDRSGYATALQKLRRAVRRYRLHEVRPGSVDRELLRAIATDVGFRPKLRRRQLLSSVAGATESLLDLTPLGLTGTVIAVWVALSALWDGRVPRRLSGVKWLRPVLSWDIESQAPKE